MTPANSKLLFFLSIGIVMRIKKIHRRACLAAAVRDGLEKSSQSVSRVSRISEAGTFLLASSMSSVSAGSRPYLYSVAR